ncbi:MAG: glycosyltransferase family 9 protein, partial [Candidatus Methylopumilus sp.]|nr:glycosyltransferase family 9 protein [Candidatus Methylopumilus sp.]
LDINLQPQRSSSNKLDLEWIQEYIKCKIKLSLILVLHLNAVQRVGLVWAGSTKHENDANRSLALDALDSLLQVDVEWHSLHKEYRLHDQGILHQYPQLLQHQDAIQDFSDTAALIECLDLVITVDTSVAHLAGAMGKPVWILIPFAPDYRWLLDREDSPWYPTARLFRQPVLNDWDSVIPKIIQALQRYIKQS